MSHILKIHVDWSKHKDKKAIGDKRTNILIKINLIEYVNNKLTKPKERKDFNIPSNEKNLKGKVKFAKNNFEIFSYKIENDNSEGNIYKPIVRKIDETK